MYQFTDIQNLDYDDTVDKAYIGLRSHADTISHTVTFPSQTGSANQFLMTDNSGNLSWNSIASATSPKQSCIVATTGNITLSGTQTIDGISVTATKRVLVKEQTDASEKGSSVCAEEWSEQLILIPIVKRLRIIYVYKRNYKW